MNSPSAASTKVPAREKAQAATAAATARTGPRRQRANAPASTAAAPAPATGYAHPGAHASGQPTVTSPRAAAAPRTGVFMIAKDFDTAAE